MYLPNLKVQLVLKPRSRRTIRRMHPSLPTRCFCKTSVSLQNTRWYLYTTSNYLFADKKISPHSYKRTRGVNTYCSALLSVIILRSLQARTVACLLHSLWYNFLYVCRRLFSYLLYQTDLIRETFRVPYLFLNFYFVFNQPVIIYSDFKTRATFDVFRFYRLNRWWNHHRTVLKRFA